MSYSLILRNGLQEIEITQWCKLVGRRHFDYLDLSIYIATAATNGKVMKQEEKHKQLAV